MRFHVVDHTDDQRPDRNDRAHLEQLARPVALGVDQDHVPHTGLHLVDREEARARVTPLFVEWLHHEKLAAVERRVARGGHHAALDATELHERDSRLGAAKTGGAILWRAVSISST